MLNTEQLKEKWHSREPRIRSFSSETGLIDALYPAFVEYVFDMILMNMFTVKTDGQIRVEFYDSKLTPLYLDFVKRWRNDTKLSKVLRLLHCSTFMSDSQYVPLTSFTFQIVDDEFVEKD